MYPKFSSISWTDLDGGQGFFLVSGRRWTRFLVDGGGRDFWWTVHLMDEFGRRTAKFS